MFGVKGKPQMRHCGRHRCGIYGYAYRRCFGCGQAASANLVRRGEGASGDRDTGTAGDGSGGGSTTWRRCVPAVSLAPCFPRRPPGVGRERLGRLRAGAGRAAGAYGITGAADAGLYRGADRGRASRADRSAGRPRDAAAGATDMRKGFDGLAAVAQGVLGKDPLPSGGRTGSSQALTRAASVLPLFTASSKPPSSTASTRRPGYATPSPASQTTQPAASTNSCPGTSHPPENRCSPDAYDQASGARLQRGVAQVPV